MARRASIERLGASGRAAERATSGTGVVEAEVKGAEEIGAIGVESGAISNGLFRFCARDWPTRPVKARGFSGSAGLMGVAGVERARNALRAPGPVVREARLDAAAEGENDDEPDAVRVSDSMITIPSSPARDVTDEGRPCPGPEDQRAGAVRSAIGEDAGRAGDDERAGPAKSPRIDGEKPPPAVPRAGPGPGPRPAPGRGGNGCASRLSSEVSAQIARNVSGTMNWSRKSNLIRGGPWCRDQDP
jgi:hypothetical protein